jgi:outer membrane protein TolC
VSAVGAAPHFASAVLVALGALLASAAAAVARADPLPFDAALRLAEARSLRLSAQEAGAASARQMAIAAGQRPDPVLKAGIVNLPVDGPDRFSLTRDFMTMRSVGVMQELTGSRKLHARADRFEREAEVAEAGRRLALAALQRDTAAAWLDRHFEELLRTMLLAQRDEARLQVDAADAAYRGGRGAQPDVFEARSAVAQIEDAIAQADRRVASARIRLARWVGARGADDALGAAPPLGTVGLRDEEIERVLARHPAIDVMGRQEAAAEAVVEVERANDAPTPTVELMFSQRGPAYSNMVSVNVSVPLPWNRAQRQDRAVAAGLATVERLRAEREEATREQSAELRSMLEEWRSQRRRLDRYDASLLPLAGERTRAALACLPRRLVVPGGGARVAPRRDRDPLRAPAARDGGSAPVGAARVRRPADADGHRSGFSGRPRKEPAMTLRPLVTGFAAAAALALAGLGLYRLGLERGAGMGGAAAAPEVAAPAASAAGGAPIAAQGAASGEDATRRHIASGLKAGDIDPVTGRRILYYHDPMVPASRFDKPARSPVHGHDAVAGVCGAGERRRPGDGEPARAAEPRRAHRAGQRRHAVDAALGRRQHRLQRAGPGGRAGARHRLRGAPARARHARPGARRPALSPTSTCRTGSPPRMSSSPCGACRAPSSRPSSMAARQRMRQVGMSEAQIRLVETTGRTQPRLSPAGADRRRAGRADRCARA